MCYQESRRKVDSREFVLGLGCASPSSVMSEYEKGENLLP